MSSLQELEQNLSAFRQRYFLDKVMKGLFLFASVTITAFLSFSGLEYLGRFDTAIRFFLFFAFTSTALFSLVFWILIPSFQWFRWKHFLNDEKASGKIAGLMPEVGDRLLNTLQLKNYQNNSLATASLQQRATYLNQYRFADSIKLEKNRKYLKFLILPLAGLISLAVFLPGWITESPYRIVHFSKTFATPAPFEFVMEKSKWQAFRNDDVNLKVRLEGKALPTSVYLVQGDSRILMQNADNETFEWTIKNIQESSPFHFEAAGYSSESFDIQVMNKPVMKGLWCRAVYPAYTGRKAEEFPNAGNMSVPEGTQLNWILKTEAVGSVLIRFEGEQEKEYTVKSAETNVQHKAKRSGFMQFKLKPEEKGPVEEVQYQLSVIPDRFPELKLEEWRDSVLLENIVFGGNISDDYGFSALYLKYQYKTSGQKIDEKNYQKIQIPISSKSLAQSFFYDWSLKAFSIKPGDEIVYYFEVWDNDGVNGSKASRSGLKSLRLPDAQELEEQFQQKAEEADKQMQQFMQRSEQLKRDLKKAQDKMRSKQSLSWQDKQELEQILQQHRELQKEMEAWQKQMDELFKQEEKFQELDPELLKKMAELQKLMEELLDEETKKLMEELEKLLQEKAPKEQLDKKLEELQKKDGQLNEEMNRALELFKNLEMDRQLEQNQKKMEELAEKQEKLSEKTTQEKGQNPELQKEQEKLNAEFDSLKQELKEMQELNESLEQPRDLDTLDNLSESIDQEQQNSMQQMQQQNNQKAGKSQKKAADQMKEMAQQMENQQSSMDMEQAEEDLNDLRQLLDNLVRLSFEQEQLMKDLKSTSQQDPKYLAYTQKQIDLKADAEQVRDSLVALAKRVYQIEAFVTREAGKMESNMVESIEYMRKRRPDLVQVKQQQALTSINNLALLLSDVMKQMQEQMMNSMSMPGGKSCKKPGQKPQPGNMGELQKQLNQQIQDLKQNGPKPGSSMSEELARLAAQQEMLRKALKDLEEKMKQGGQQPGNQMNELNRLMEETEKDLVNKQLNDRLIQRQKEIETRLLEAENALRERETDEQRESRTGKEEERKYPPEFDKYIQKKNQQSEWLKTIPPGYTPYYKEEVDKYFHKIEK